MSGAVDTGSKHGSAKLTEAQIPEIRRLYVNGYSQPQLARRFGVSQMTINAIVRRKIWTHVESNG